MESHPSKSDASSSLVVFTDQYRFPPGKNLSELPDKLGFLRSTF